MKSDLLVFLIDHPNGESRTETGVGSELLSIGGERDGRVGFAKHSQHLPGRRVPHSHGGVRAGRGEPAAVGTERHGENVPGARAKLFRQIEEFFNLNLYDYKVEIGPTKEVK